MADFFDRFVGAAGLLTGHTADSGDTWGPSGYIGSSLDGSGAAYCNSDINHPTNWYQGNIAVSSWTPPGADYSAQMVLGSDGANAAQPFVGVRCSGTNGAVAGYIAGTYENQLDLYRIGGGTYTALLNGIPGPVTSPGDVFEMQIAGSSPVVITLLLNGTSIGSYSDSSGGAITGAGSVGLVPGANDSSSPQSVVVTLWAGAIGGPSESIRPSAPTVHVSGTQAFTAGGLLPASSPTETVSWAAGSGSVDGSGNYTAPASGTSDTVTWTSVDLPTHTATAEVTLVAGSLALSGPSSGTTGSASTNFTVAATSLSGSDTVTCASDSGGSFTTSPLTFSSGTSSQTFTYTAAADGTHSISITDSMGATISGSPVSFASTTPIPTPTPTPTATAKARNGTSAARRAAFIAGLTVSKPARLPVLVTAPLPVKMSAPKPPPEPLRPAVSDARPSKAKLDFPMRGGK